MDRTDEPPYPDTNGGTPGPIRNALRRDNQDESGILVTNVFQEVKRTTRASKMAT
jgi:hypothetical protein